ncbi:MAG: hypothetical protein NTX23_01830 [Candidatus Bipolaricaulota bacterium]|nr:hypothetical protein [Candidatus Bipolaricaulota bacterium]
MSFATAEYLRGGKDILIGTDRRWCCGPDDALVVHDDNGLKSLDLNSDVGVAFTGRAAVMAKVFAELYEDASLLSVEPSEVFKILEARDHILGMNTQEIVLALDRIVPGVVGSFVDRQEFSIILAGKRGKKPTMYWWEDKQLKGQENLLRNHVRVRTLPMDASLDVERSADAILSGHGTAMERINRTVSYLSTAKGVRSVGGGCLFRLQSKGFARA